MYLSIFAVDEGQILSFVIIASLSCHLCLRKVIELHLYCNFKSFQCTNKNFAYLMLSDFWARAFELEPMLVPPFVSNHHKPI